MSEAQPRTADFENVRDGIRIIDRVYERAMTQAQEHGFEDGVLALRRRRALLDEMLQWLEAREDLGEIVRSSVAVAVTLPPGGWLG